MVPALKCENRIKSCMNRQCNRYGEANRKGHSIYAQCPHVWHGFLYAHLQILHTILLFARKGLFLVHEMASCISVRQPDPNDFIPGHFYAYFPSTWDGINGPWIRLWFSQPKKIKRKDRFDAQFGARGAVWRTLKRLHLKPVTIKTVDKIKTCWQRNGRWKLLHSSVMHNSVFVHSMSRVTVWLI